MTECAGHQVDDGLVNSVTTRRCIGWGINVVLIIALIAILAAAMAWFGRLTMGMGIGVFALLPGVPFVDNWLSLLRPVPATPGQQTVGLAVRRYDDLGAPIGFQAAIFTIGYFATIATSRLLLIVELATDQHWPLHDMVSGSVVVRRDALDELTYAG